MNFIIRIVQVISAVILATVTCIFVDHIALYVQARGISEYDAKDTMLRCLGDKPPTEADIECFTSFTKYQLVMPREYFIAATALERELGKEECNTWLECVLAQKAWA